MITQEQSERFISRVFAGSQVLKPAVVMPYGTQISPHIKVGVDHVASPDTGEVALLPGLVRLFEQIRSALGRPIQINAGFRTVQHEADLTAAGYETAHYVSPHCVGCAFDLYHHGDGDQIEANVELQDALKIAATQLDLPAPRLGHKLYKERFCHVDLVYLLFVPYGELDLQALVREFGIPEQLVSNWQPGVEW